MIKRFVLPIATLAFASWGGANAHGQSCCAPGNGQKASSVEAKPATLELAIEGMTSDQSAASISEALDDLEGVRRADISFARNRGVVEYNSTLTDAVQIMEAVRRMKRNGEGTYDVKRNLPSDRVSLFDVPLECTAAPEIGCGPIAKPLLSALEGQPGVSEAWLNRAGTSLAIVWAEDANQQQRDGAIRLLLSNAVNDVTREARPKEITGPQHASRLDEFLRLTGVWYRDTAIHALFEYEAEVIAKRLVRRVQAQVALEDATAQAVAQVLVAAVREHMTQDLTILKEWVETRMNDDLLEAASSHLDDNGIAAMQKALEIGFRPLPSEDGPAAAPRTLKAWEPIDETFRLCEGGCGKRVAGGSLDVTAQPGATLGQNTYCPVSGVVFQINKTSLQRSIDGKAVYFCCSGCAAYFDAHREHLIAMRGLAGTSNAP